MEDTHDAEIVGALRQDIGVHRLAAIHRADGALGDVVQGLGGVGDPLAAVELVIARLDCGLPGRQALLFEWRRG